jgi:hypothetical protein
MLAKWAGLAAVIIVLLAWAASTLFPAGWSFDRWRVESFGGLIVLMAWGDGPGFKTSTPYLLAHRGQWGLEWPSLSGRGATLFYATLPWWVVCLFAGLPTAGLWLLARRPFGRGRCRRCGYDLRGNTLGVCPECGAGVSGAG